MNDKKRFYALEYQEISGNFHYNFLDGMPPYQNTVGYRTVAIGSFDDCYDFCQSISEKYDMGKKPYPTFAQIVQEWNSIIDTKSVIK